MSQDFRLSSVLFVLQTQSVIPKQKYFGRAAYAIFLAMINKLAEMEENSTYQFLAKDFHGRNEPIPFTVNDLRIPNTDQFHLRITSIGDTMGIILDMLGQHTPFSIVVDKRKEKVIDWEVLKVKNHHFWSRESSGKKLIKTYWKKPVQGIISLYFHTPTAIQSMGFNRSMPIPKLVFKTLFRRWQNFSLVNLPFNPSREQLEAFCEQYITLDVFSGNTKINHKAREISAYQGHAVYKIHYRNASYEKLVARLDEDAQQVNQFLRDNHHHFCCLINLLANFAFYCGVGIQTAQGMGMVYLLP